MNHVQLSTVANIPKFSTIISANFWTLSISSFVNVGPNLCDILEVGFDNCGIHFKRSILIYIIVKLSVTINIHMLKSTAAPPLTKLFQYIHTQWHTTSQPAGVVPIPKDTAQDTLIGSVVNKLLEQHFYHITAHHLDKNLPTSQQQWGFQKGKSTVTSHLC